MELSTTRRLTAATILAALGVVAACDVERDEGTQASSAGSRAGRTGNMPPYPDVATEQGRGVLGTGGLGSSGDPQTYNDRGASGFTLTPVATAPESTPPQPVPDAQSPMPPAPK